MRLVVLTDVLEFKSLRQIKIKLHCRQLPQTSNRVLDLNVNFRTVKRSLIFYSFIGKRLALEGLNQGGFATFPILIRTQILLTRILAPDGQFNFKLLETKCAQQCEREIYADDNLATDCFRRTEDVS